MNIKLREAKHTDIPFLTKMLYEAVFWRRGENKPSFEEGLAFPMVGKALTDWGERDRDTAVVALSNSVPIAAAWYRFWTDDNFINGYIEKITPVLVIAVHKDFRHQGVGGEMIAWLVDQASRQGIEKISLSVSKDNYAINLYRQHGFMGHTEREASYLMIRPI